MAVTNRAGFGLVVAAVTIGSTAVGAILPTLLLQSSNNGPDEARLAGHMIGSGLGMFFGPVGLCFGLLFGVRLAKEMFHEKAASADSPCTSLDSAIEAEQSTTEPT